MKQFRQGDIFILEVSELPDLENENYFSTEGKAETDRIVLAYGEVTGHAHAIKDQNVFLRKSANDNNFFLIVDNECDLVHEEHSTIKIPAGNYKVIRQREYFPNEIRTVAD